MMNVTRAATTEVSKNPARPSHSRLIMKFSHLYNILQTQLIGEQIFKFPIKITSNEVFSNKHLFQKTSTKSSDQNISDIIFYDYVCE